MEATDMLTDAKLTNTKTITYPLTFGQKAYIFICDKLLFMKTFKKYWPVGGSYWNKCHTDSKSKYDLQKILDDANEYTRQHIQGTFMLSVLTFGQLIAKSKTRDAGIVYVMLFGIELYAFVAHHYNRIIAKNKLKNLPQESVREDIKIEKSVRDSKRYLMIDADYRNDQYYVVTSKNLKYITINRIFVSKSDADKLAEYIMTNHTEDQFLEAIYTDGCKDMYKSYKESKENCNS